MRQTGDRMKKVLNIVLPLLIILIVTASAVPAAALNGPSASDYQVNWVNPKSVVGSAQSKDEFSFFSYVNGAKRGFNISFPAGGGIRLSGDSKGFFSPETVSAITYENISEGKIRMTAESGMTAVFETNGESWKLSALDKSKKESFALSSAEIYFGFQYGTVKKVKISHGISSDEVIYGFGGRMNAVNQVGKSFMLWNRDGGDSDGDDAYINVPILNSTKGYTLFFNSTYAGRADIGKSQSGIYTLDFNGSIFDAFIFTGTNSENMSSYTAITGKPVTAPKWALSYWAGAQQNYWLSQGVDRYLDVIEETFKKYKDMGITLAALYAEGIPSNDTATYDIADKYGSRILYWNYPDDTEEETAGIAEKDLPILKDILNPFSKQSIWCIDYTNPSSLITIKNRYSKFWNAGKTGLKGTMVDYGEYVTEESLAYNGKTGDEMHNLWAYYYCKAMFDAWNEGVKDKDFILFARAGCAGCQTYNANFTGDQASTWNGLEDQVQAILSMSASGFNLVGGDIGGFSGKPTSELYMRWLQFGTFSPLMRAHGTQCRDPWSYGKRAEKCFTEHYWLRENIIDLLYSTMLSANKTGVPMVQSMPAAFPDNAVTAKNETQYMFCGNLLVCPVVKDMVSVADVVLPSGKWYDLWSGSEYIGSNAAIKADAPMNRLPIFIKSGAVFPIELSDTFRLTDEIKDYNGNKALLVTPPEREEKTTVYADDGEEVYNVIPAEGGSFKISAENGGKKKYILLYGEDAEEITTDGKSLSLISQADIKKKPGFYRDGANRTVISLPDENWKEIEIKGKAIKDMANGCLIYTDSGTEIPALTDGDISTDTLVTAKMGGLTLDLGKVKNVSQVAIKWGAGYAEGYTLTGSADGENWTELYSVKDGNGGAEYISVEPVNIRYINLSKIKKATGQQMRMHSFEVYGYDVSDTASHGINNLTATVIIAAAGAVLATAAVVFAVITVKKKKYKKQ